MSKPDMVAQLLEQNRLERDSMSDQLAFFERGMRTGSRWGSEPWRDTTRQDIARLKRNVAELDQIDTILRTGGEL